MAHICSAQCARQAICAHIHIIFIFARRFFCAFFSFFFAFFLLCHRFKKQKKRVTIFFAAFGFIFVFHIMDRFILKLSDMCAVLTIEFILNGFYIHRPFYCSAFGERARVCKMIVPMQRNFFLHSTCGKTNEMRLHRYPSIQVSKVLSNKIWCTLWSIGQCGESLHVGVYFMQSFFCLSMSILCV